jgi:hypothetical protein
VVDGGESGWDYFILPEAWKAEVCRGFDAKTLAHAMILRGLLLPDRDGKHLAKTIEIPGYKKSGSITCQLQSWTAARMRDPKMALAVARTCARERWFHWFCGSSWSGPEEDLGLRGDRCWNHD